MERWLEFVHRPHPWLDAIWRRLQSRLEIWLEGWSEPPDRPEADFVTDTDYYMIQQEPLRARILLRALAVALVLFLVWAGTIQIDEITKGEGKVIPARQVQVLQSLDGGIVSEISVQEGQVVQAGQILLKIDSTRFESSVLENRSQYFSLLAKASRLRALSEGKPFQPPPPSAVQGDLKPEDLKTVEEERNLYETRTSELNAQVGIARQQLVQHQQELVEMRAKREQAAQAYELSAKELAVTKPLLKSGAVSEIDLLRLERDVDRFHGERDMAAAQISRAQAAIAEANHKIQEVELNFRNDAGKELADTMGKLNALTQGNVGLADKVKHSAIRSPVRGTVKRLLVNTVGGVVQPGRDIVEVVPLDDKLLLEAKVHPKDIAFLRPGQNAVVKFTAYNFSIYGGLDATLENIGADSVTDERGNAYYVVRVRTFKSKLGEDLPIIPGMVAEVDIITGHKSLLAYLLYPVLRAKQGAFTER